MHERYWQAARAALGLMLFGIALGVLHHELRAYRYQDIVAELHRLPGWRIGAGLGLTVLSYVVLTGYDRLAFAFIHHPLSYRRIALASFIAYVFSHNVGPTFLGGSAVRFRLYSGWGLTTSEIATVVSFNVVTFWLGFLLLLGTALLVAPPLVPARLQLPVASTGVLGGLCLAVLAGYLIAVTIRKAPLRWRTWELGVPPPRLSAAQLALSTVDWALAAGVLYVLLPPLAGASFVGFLAVFLLAQILGVLSNVPAGLGVFETVILFLLPPVASSVEILGSLVAYRLIYYLVPLVVGVGLLVTYEVFESREHLARAGRFAARWVPGIVPHALAFTTFLGGAILLASGIIPAENSRLAWLSDVLPLPVIEASHFAGSLAGVGLLLLARGLQRRLDAAYVLAALLLASGALVSLLDGLDYEEAVVLSLMLAALLPCRRHFYRRAALLNEPLSPPWIMAILLVLLGSGWLLLLSYQHVQYSNDLWWRFELSANAPRALRAEAGAIVLLTICGAARLLRPARPAPAPPSAEELERVGALVAASPATRAYLALLGDKRFLFSASRSSFIMYGVEGRTWVALGDPIGAPAETRELAWSFRELSDRHAGRTVFYEVGPENLPLYLDLGLSLLKLGELARVPLPSFTLEGGARRPLRRSCARLEREGCSWDIVRPEGVRPILAELKTISDAWLAEKHTREKCFSLGFFNPQYLAQLPLVVVHRQDRIVAFANLLLGAEREEISIDLMRHLPTAPAGVMDYILVEIMLWGKQQGYRWFNLGMAPMSGFEDRALAPLWSRVGSFLFRYGEHFYNFQGLRQYKEKFDPAWEPRYLASPGGLALPRIVTNVASLISGGLKGVVAK
jgi:phosphatidylglycerol lysyltransferase